MTCEETCDRLPEFVVGAMSAREASATEAHLTECPACAQEHRALLEAGRLVDSLPPLRPARDLWPETAARLSPHRPRRRSIPDLLGLEPRWAALAAACAAIGVALIIHGPLRHGGLARSPIVEATAEDPDAALVARWSIEANLDAGMTDPYAAAIALAALPDSSGERSSQ